MTRVVAGPFELSRVLTDEGNTQWMSLGVLAAEDAVFEDPYPLRHGGEFAAEDRQGPAGTVGRLRQTHPVLLADLGVLERYLHIGLHSSAQSRAPGFPCPERGRLARRQGSDRRYHQHQAGEQAPQRGVTYRRRRRSAHC